MKRCACRCVVDPVRDLTTAVVQLCELVVGRHKSTVGTAHVARAHAVMHTFCRAAYAAWPLPCPGSGCKVDPLWRLTCAPRYFGTERNMRGRCPATSSIRLMDDVFAETYNQGVKAELLWHVNEDMHIHLRIEDVGKRPWPY